MDRLFLFFYDFDFWFVYLLNMKEEQGSVDIVVGNSKSRQGLSVGRKDGSERDIVPEGQCH